MTMTSNNIYCCCYPHRTAAAADATVTAAAAATAAATAAHVATVAATAATLDITRPRIRPDRTGPDRRSGLVPGY